ncbi:MAG: hypothetical protein CVV22_03910 [Ignavibacteriae bacterium HGW-Ignavibacteriae-1]|nr:MAG: hypothetical protein CVV22_03910 [Ignavibacteriae bacterium HGW-Ignavibacteriae-1]
MQLMKVNSIAKYFLIFIAIFTFGSSVSYSQSGLKFSELAQRLEPYFDKLLIDDVYKQLPQGVDYFIWGYDVGDFSGDDHSDLGITLRLAGDRSRNMQVYLFVDIDGFLRQVAHHTYQFVELPLEIGVVIHKNICYVTKKFEENHWKMDGYTYDNGSILLSEIFNTGRVGDLTHESVRNYQTLRGSEKYINTRSGKELFYRDFLSIPTYRRGRTVYKGYFGDTFANYTDFVHEGAYDWKGEKDCSFRVTSAFDDDYLYFTVEIIDDAVVTQSCDTCISDYLDIWFDINPNPTYDRFTERNGKKVDFRTKSTKGLYRVSVFPGNFLDKEPFVKVSTNDELTEIQKEDSKLIKAVANFLDDSLGYVLKFRIPFTLFGFEGNPLDEEFYEIGCTFVVIDYDNEYRPEEKTEVATSAFIPYDPSTYGSLILIPEGKWYGESENIFTEDVIKNLFEYGF